MDVDWQPIINVGATGVLGVIGWFVKGIKDDLKAGADRLVQFQLEVSEKYVRTEMLDKIERTLERIENKLDGKVDK